MMKKAIVFGANGYLGRHISHYLNQHNIAFIPSDYTNKSIDNYPNYLSINITKKAQLQQLNFNVDFIFVFAGLTGTNIGFTEYENFVNVNENGLLNILQTHCQQKSKARIVFPSTRLVYKGKKDEFLSENSEKEALTIYAQNKLSCENYLKMYQNYYGINYTIFRICVPYGNLIDNSYSYGTLGFFLKKAKNNENITLFGDGNQRRTFTHVEDIITIIFLTLKLSSTKNNIYNIGSNDNLSLLEVANLVANKNGVKITHLTWPNDALKIESGDTIFKDKKIISTINYTYKNSLAAWIKTI